MYCNNVGLRVDLDDRSRTMLAIGTCRHEARQAQLRSVSRLQHDIGMPAFNLKLGQVTMSKGIAFDAAVGMPCLRQNVSFRVVSRMTSYLLRDLPLFCFIVFLKSFPFSCVGVFVAGFMPETSAFLIMMSEARLLCVCLGVAFFDDDRWKQHCEQNVVNDQSAQGRRSQAAQNKLLFKQKSARAVKRTAHNLRLLTHVCGGACHWPFCTSSVVHEFRDAPEPWKTSRDLWESCLYPEFTPVDDPT